MKKIFTLCTALLMCMIAFAEADETFQFTDLDGNIVSDGATIVVTELDEEGQMIVPLKLMNASGEKAAVGLYETFGDMPNGEWKTCALGLCVSVTSPGYSNKMIVDGDYHAGIETEWIPEAGKYATWEATLQIHVFNIISKSVFGKVTETVGTEVIGEGPTVTVRFEYKDPDAQPAAKVWWGYVGAEDECSGVGVGKTETYDCASFYPGNHEVASGKTIHAVRFLLFSTNVKDVKVWIAESKPTTIDDDAVQVVSVENPVLGINEVTLPTPYEIGSNGVYVGYSFTVTKLSTTGDSYCVPVTGSDMANALLLRTSVSVTSWSDLNGQGFGRLFLQLLLEGEFPYRNGASLASSNLGEVIAAIGGTATIDLPVTNEGTDPLQSIDYTIITDGVTGAEQHIDFERPVSYGATGFVALTVDGDDIAGSKEKTLAITKTNGVANEYGEVTTKYTMSTVAELVHRGVAVEEFTGTTCGWCPRGIVGMEKMRKEFGDNFVGIAIHRYTTSTSKDAMYISAYSHVQFGGAPSCRIDRGPVIDPYYGSVDNVLDDFRAELAIPAKVAVDVTGQWNADSTKVEATATLNSVLPGTSFKIEYVLIADSLTGTGTPWQQHNYYNSAYGQYSSAKDLPRDLGFLFNTGTTFGSGQNTYVAYYPIFNDVAIAVAKSTQTTAPGLLTVGEPVTNTYTLSMPTNATLKNAITKKNVAVVALVIDTKTNRIANAAKFYMPGYDPILSVKGVNTVSETATQRYALDGRRLPAAQKGLNIVRQADGSVRKVMVK